VRSTAAFPPLAETAGQPIFMHILQPTHLSGKTDTGGFF
jgi:hypothetical protein